jgi:predicted phosphate transport protein (TIGR00153 family)
MGEASKSILMTIIDHVFPKTADFFQLLTDQSIQVTRTVSVLVEFMETADPELGLEIKKDEHEADAIKVRNIHTLNEAFSTPIDREDIYRAITDLDEIVNYCKTTVNEMDILGVHPDHFTLEMARLLKDGVDALANGYSKLGVNPSSAAVDADAARKAERRVEKLYRKALADLFQGDEYINMFKRREIYRHLTNAADRMAHCANTLHDIVVKIC